MKITTQITGLAQLVRNMYAATNYIIDCVVDACQKTVMECIVAARSLPSPPHGIEPHQPNYRDQSSNLRNSIGAVVYVGDEEVFSSFGTGAGATKGKSFADSLASQHFSSQGIICVIVAGMDYALKVESKGYDVITGSCEKLPDMLETNLKLAKQAIENRQKL